MISAAALLLFLWNGGAFLPRWISWEDTEEYDASGRYRLLAAHKSVQILYGEDVIWCAPDGVKVQKALFSDIDNDGQDELVLLCWKRGRYGKSKPVWVEKDEQGWSQHLFVYEVMSKQDMSCLDMTKLVKPKWMSSYLGQDVSKLASNQKSAPYNRLWLTDLEGNVSSWVWDSWGFTKEETDISFVAFGDLLAHEPIYRYGLQNGGDFVFCLKIWRT